MNLAGDLAYVAAERNQLERTLTIFGRDEKPARRVIIGGAGNIGVYVATELERRVSGASVKVVEPNAARALEIADNFKHGVVLNGSALDEVVLKEADVSNADTFVAVTNDERVNILSAGLAKKLGCRRSLSLVNSTTFAPLLADLGVDMQVNPRGVTVSRILRHVRRGRIRELHSVLEGKGELIEAEALETSPLVGVPLRELNVFEGMRIGAIYRGGKIILPHGDTVLQAADRVILFAEAERVKKVEQLFRVSLEFF